MIFQRTMKKQYPRTRLQQGRVERGREQGCRCEFYSRQRDSFPVESKTCPGNGVAGCLGRKEPSLGQWVMRCPQELSGASLIQSRIQIPLAFPDGLIVWIGNRWWPLLVLSTGPAASPYSSGHRLGLGLSILAPVIHQQ